MEPHFFAVLSEVSSGVVLSFEDPLGGKKTLDSDGTAGVDPRRGDPDFCSEAEAEPVRKSGTRIVEDACAVYVLLEVLRCLDC